MIYQDKFCGWCCRETEAWDVVCLEGVVPDTCAVMCQACLPAYFPYEDWENPNPVELPTEPLTPAQVADFLRQVSEDNRGIHSAREMLA